MRRRLLEVYILRQLNIKHWSKVYFELYFLLFKVLKDSLSLKRMSTWLWFWNQKISVVIKLSANYCIFSSVIFFRMGKTLFQVLLLKILTDNGHTKIPLSWYAKKKKVLKKLSVCMEGLLWYCYVDRSRKIQTFSTSLQPTRLCCNLSQTSQHNRTWKSAEESRRTWVGHRSLLPNNVEPRKNHLCRNCLWWFASEKLCGGGWLLPSSATVLI